MKGRTKTDHTYIETLFNIEISMVTDTLGIL